MAKYIRLFNNHSDYSTFKGTDDYIEPNVSHCVSENEMHYNAINHPLIATFNVEDDYQYQNNYYPHISFVCTSSDVNICSEQRFTRDTFSKIVIDGVEVSLDELDANDGKYNLSLGQHTVEYTLADPTTIKAYSFADGSRLTSVVIPDNVTKICADAFDTCQGLVNVSLGNDITTIEDSAFVFMTTIPLNEASIQAIKAINENGIYKESIK